IFNFLVKIFFSSCQAKETLLNSLNEEDFVNAENLSKEELYREMTLEEKAWVYRSEIRWNLKQNQNSVSNFRTKRNGVSRPQKLWPNARIPYMISSQYTPHERALLAKAVKQYHDRSCVKFVARTPADGDYLFIGKVDGCFSEVGRTSGVQVLSLDNGCMDYSTIIHEIMHVVGFYHEHERWDRDQYIDIIWPNIDKGALDQFGKMDLSKTSYYGQPYDYKSILHYDSLAFSKNGLPTMLPKKTGFATTIGNARDFSEIDLMKINKMYGCEQQQQKQNTQQKISLIAQHSASKSKTQILPPFSLLIASEGKKEKLIHSNFDDKIKIKATGNNRPLQGFI
ncbi:Metalloendopeptidase, partial [Meloidogyne graminicola]